MDNRFDLPHPGQQGDDQPRFGTAPRALLDGFEGLGGQEIEVHVISCVPSAATSSRKLADNIWYHPLTVPRWGFLRSLYLGCVLAVARKLRELKVDIVHAQGTERWCGVAGAFAPTLKVLTIHGNIRLISRMAPAKPWLYWKLQALLEIFSIPRFDGLVAISRYTELNARGLAKRSWLMPNAVESSFFDIPLSPKDPPELLVVANIQARKNQIAFLDALVPLAKKQNFRVRFFGHAPAGDDFANDFLERIRAYPWCSFEGTADRATLRQAFSQATLLALPTLEDNCPMSVLEAMAAGIPVVAANVGGVPDLIRDNENGLLCDPSDPGSMRQMVERLLNDSDLRKRLSQNAREDAKAHFTPHIVAKRHLEIYRELVETRSRR